MVKFLDLQKVNAQYADELKEDYRRRNGPFIAYEHYRCYRYQRFSIPFL